MTTFHFDGLRRGALLPMVIVTAILAGCQDEASAEGAIAVPSGRDITLIDLITDVPGPEGQTARFRFLAPGLLADDAEAAATDMEALCNDYALPRIAALVPKPAQIIVSLSSAPVPFGETAPEVVQLFEAYRVEGNTCVWMAF